MNPSKTSLNEGSRTGFWSRSLLLLWAAAILCPTASAQWNAGYTLCAPQYTGVPFTYKPPAVDATFVTTFLGDVDSDTGWTGAFRYVLSNGTLLPDGAFQIIQDSTSHQIYLSFQMKHDPTFDTEDSIVLGFDPDHLVLGDGITHPNMQRLIIHPVVGGVGATSGDGSILPGQIEYWKGWVQGSGWQNSQTAPAFVTVVARSALNPGDNSWDVQVKIDNAVLGLPASPTPFGIYVNLIRIDSTIPPNTDTQFTWPASAPLKLLIPGSEVVLEGDSLPDTANWGTGSLATTCSGVNISYSDITSNHSGVISLNNPNQFSVLMHNTGASAAGQVFATFQIANFGLPSAEDWMRPGELFSNLIPGDPLPSDPSPPTVGIGSGGGTNTLSTGSWVLGANPAKDGSTPLDEHDFYQANSHQCIRVVLSSLASDTIFSVRSSWNNFGVGNTSEFKDTAMVGTKGYKLPEGAKNHEFNLAVTSDYTPACMEPGLIAKNPDLRYSWFMKVVHGCRITGNHVVISKKKFADCEDVGSYGYNLRHEGAVKGFTDNLSGPGLEKRGKGNSYHLTVAPGQKAMLATTVVSQGGAKGGGREVGGGHPPACGETNKRQGGAAAAGLILIGLFTFFPSRKKRG
jgi:hypothetical protein